MSGDRILKFGAIILIESNYYVFLSQTASAVYLAKVIRGNYAFELVQYRERLEYFAEQGNKGAQNKLSENMLFSFVKLTTEEFDDCIVHLLRTQYSSNELDKTEEVVKDLNNNDLEELRKEILEGSFPQDLKSSI